MAAQPRPADLLALVEALARRVPSWPDAACRGRSNLFDATTTRDQAEALQLCSTCPVLRDCRRYVAGLPLARRPIGVVAGRIQRPRDSGRHAIRD